MSSQSPGSAASSPNADLVRQYDGHERIPQLAHAALITLAPSTDPDEPVDVLIEWSPGQVEKPLPGSALWRAVLEGRLARPVSRDPAERLIRRQVQRSLERFPDLESWWHWVRTGWTAPPKPDSEAGRRRRTLGGLFRRFRRR
jgi:hypothetical protein